jgi:hypothetical protein
VLVVEKEAVVAEAKAVVVMVVPAGEELILPA